ncbi:MAG: MarR family transcriptional regulator [Candidatus Thorarchaeota archaeon]|nr:MarR family transcriptional regulator [Candidatus Thorarchaeota archaeon]
MLTTSDLPRSALIVLDSLKSQGPLSPKQIASQAKLPPRTVSFALKKLIRINLCRKVPNLRDMRQPLYHLDRDRFRELQQMIDQLRIEAGILSRAF